MDSLLARRTAQILGFGVSSALLVTAVGSLLYLIAEGAEPVHVQAIRSDLSEPQGIIKQALLGNSEAIIQSGILLLIAVPIVRVFYMIFLFKKAHDPLYAGISFVLFLILMVSLMLT